MKKLSKTFKLLLFMLACMVLCGTKAYAASFTLPAQGSTKIIDVTGVKRHKGCTVSGSAAAYLTVDDKLSAGRLVVNVESNNTTDSQKVADVVCTFVNTSGKTLENTVNVVIEGKTQVSGVGTVTKYLAPGESFDVRAESTFDITEIRKFTYTSGSDRNVMDYTCEPGNGICRIDFISGVGAKKDQAHTFDIEYKDSLGFLKKGTIKLLEVSVMDHPRIYPGGMLVCDWENAKGDWTYTTAELSNGKDYSFYYTEDKNATLPDCYVSGTADTYYIFDGWNSAVNDDDVLNTGNKCVSKVNPGSKVVGANAYAPCFKIKPTLKVSVNGGIISDSSWEFYSRDMTYIKKGSKEGEKTYLPTVTFSGTAANSKVREWVNYTTGETLTVQQAKTTQVELNGDTWIAVIDKVYTQVDLYKNIAVGATETFAVNDMKSCSAPSTTYLSVSNPSAGDCRVEAGDTATPDGVYADVIVTMKDGTKRTYKFSVEDMTGHNQNGNGEFIVDTNPNIIIGQNDDTTLNTFYTNQCDEFDITNESFNGALVDFAYSTYYINNESKNVELNSSTYRVTSRCPSDKTNYIAFCLDPGRRGPGEYGSESSAIYVRQDQIDPKTDFGKMIAYIVDKEGIADFNNGGSPKKDNDISDDKIIKRVASHIAIRVSAIKNGYSTAIDTSDLKYATHYYPYAALALKMKEVSADGNIGDGEGEAIVNYTSSDGWGMTWSKPKHIKIRNELVEILENYDGSNGEVDEIGFERTIDKTNVETINGGKGYKITYTGTITAPSETKEVYLCGTSDLKTSGGKTDCAVKYKTARGVTVKAETFTQKPGTATGNRLVYDYKITVTANNANAVKVPKTAEEEKEVSLQLVYKGGTTLENAFLATAKNGTNNLQRMIVISTTNPTIFVYFNIVPNNCDLPFLNPANCMSEESCTINEDLFKASGCCRYILDEKTYKYVYESVCRVQCTNSTLSSVCNYLPDGSGKADLYTIQEGARWDSSKKKYVESLGACVVNVTDPYENDGAAKITDSSASYMKDDAENTRNVETYERNRYCQVTCEEDWTLGIDAFGNFVGRNAVAAGTYFQNIKNDLYIGGKRTCYTTFVNYDRYMANLVDFSEKIVEAYNSYSEWSHAWTDIDKQKPKGVGAAEKNGTYNFEIVDTKCVEYWDKCPGNLDGKDYYWSDNGSGRQKCRHVPNHNGGTPSCEALTNNSTHTDAYAYSDGNPWYNNSSQNNDDTKCQFTRYYCDGDGLDNIVSATITTSGSTRYCDYSLEKDRSSYDATTTTKDRPSMSTNLDGTCSWTGVREMFDTEIDGKCYADCEEGYSVSSSNSKKCVRTYCTGGETPSGNTCYRSCNYNSSGWSVKSGDKSKCVKTVEDKKATEDTKLTVGVVYDTTYLRCRTYGHGYSYSMDTLGNIEKGSGGKDDLYYSTNPTTKVDLANKGDNMTETFVENDGKVKGNYDKLFDHQCTIKAAAYKPKATGSVECNEVTDDFDGGGVVKTDKMYCMQYADLADDSKDNTFCYAGDRATSNNKDGGSTSSSDPDKVLSFKDIIEQFLAEAKEETDTYRSIMMSYHSQIYSHTYDMFYCQNFQLHNQTDTLVSGRAQNPNKRNSNGLYLGAAKDYVKIYTYFDPKAAYTYEEEQFMTILGKDNVIEPYIEKNDAAYGGTGSYYGTSNAVKNVNMQTTTGQMTLPLYRNYLENYYYNPSTYWKEGTAAFREYKDATQKNDLGNPNAVGIASKTITLCTVGVEHVGTGHGYAKEGEVVAFALTQSTPEWLGGYCRDVTVQYKEAHYVKASISNSSFYKNKGYWYIRGGDVKEHGDSLEDAFEKANNRTGSKTNYKYTTSERQRWSLLGSFNVFPVSMATPRNLYQYTYTFGDIGSFSGTKGELGRIMGNDKSIIKDNTRSCFYEVYEEVCLCCGFSMKTDKNTANFVNKNKSKYSYKLTDMDDVENNKGGTIAFYTNSVSLSNIDQGRESANRATNWSMNSPFMYSGDDKLTTDKGFQLQKEIEAVGENVYADSPEYAYYLTPDVLAEIRTYNDKYGYEVNFNNLVVYGNTTIIPTNTCSASSVGGCEWKATEQTINFQHYASKFLAGKVDGTDVDITKYSYGSIKKNANKVCIITDKELSNNIGKGKISDLIQKKGCRWVDYVETGATDPDEIDSEFINPTTGDEATIFRLAFK